MKKMINEITKEDQEKLDEVIENLSEMLHHGRYQVPKTDASGLILYDKKTDNIYRIDVTLTKKLEEG